MKEVAQIAWKKLVQDFQSPAAVADKLFGELQKKYAGRGRHYHNWQHVESLLALSERYASQLSDKQVVDFAIFYHDAVYNVLRKDNERRSAVMAMNRLDLLQVSAKVIGLVYIYIEATQTHRIPQGRDYAADLAFFLDFDMSILAADRETYRLYKEQVRKEYSLVPSALYKPGRKRFLQACLDNSSIFHTAEFRSQYEAKARANLQWELETDYGV